MNAVVSIVLLAAVLGVIVFLLSRRENGRRSQYGPAGCPNSAPTLHWTSASTGWTNTTTPTCSSTTAAGSGTAAFCYT